MGESRMPWPLGYPYILHLPSSLKINWREKHLYCRISVFRMNYYHILLMSRSGQNGEVEGIQTSKKILYSKCALVIAAGAWSGSLMQSLFTDSDIVLDVPVKPRKVNSTNLIGAWFSTISFAFIFLLKQSRAKPWEGLGNFQPCILAILLVLSMAENTWTLNGLSWKHVLIIP